MIKEQVSKGQGNEEGSLFDSIFGAKPLILYLTPLSHPPAVTTIDHSNPILQSVVNN